MQLEPANPSMLSIMVAPVTLSPPGFNPENRICVVSGFGTTSWRGFNSRTLREVSLQVLTKDMCEKMMTPRYKYNRTNMICAGGNGKDACQVHKKVTIYLTLRVRAAIQVLGYLDGLIKSSVFGLGP